jgi:hypothetical protein
MRCWLIGFVMLAGGLSWAQGQLKYVQQTVAGTSLAVPAGWAVSQSQTPVPTIKIEERAGAADSPSVLLMAVPAQPGAARFAQGLVETAMPGQRRQLGQKGGADGSVLSEWEGAIGGIPARMAVVHRATPQGGMVAAFAAPSARYDALGGSTVLLTVLSGRAPVATAAQPAVDLKIPAAYAKRAKPVLDWFADDFERIPPAQIAAGLRRLNPIEVQLLGVYTAFANLVHWRGCLADPHVRLPAGATCAQTAAGWRQTLQLLGGDVGRAIEEAGRQRSSLRIAARCSDGRTDSGTCAAYRKTMSNISRMQHESMMRIIHNLGGNGCIVGDPGCVPY